MKRIFIIIALLAIVSSSFSIAHGGRTDKNGCHKEKKTGTRHCH